MKKLRGLEPSGKRSWPYELSGWKSVCVLSLLYAVTVITASAQTFTTLVTFVESEGQSPVGSFVQGFDGNLYGVTGFGGLHSRGTVFRLTRGGALTSLYSFCSKANCTDGRNPDGGLVLAADGNFYGTTLGGGANDSGTLFKITPNGVLTTLYSFCSKINCTDGLSPIGLIRGRDGNFYGTTESGGANNSSVCQNAGCGTVFKITPNGTMTTLHSFCSQANCADGAIPYAGLVQATNGNFYGTTRQGGDNIVCFGGSSGCGTVFKITASGTLTTLYNFCSQTNCDDGAFPTAGLLQASNGNLYGTTYLGGNNNLCPPTVDAPGCGTVFEITPAGALSTLYSFCSETKCADGGNPLAGLVQASDSNFYGTTVSGGNHGCNVAIGCGTLFKITPTGAQTTLYKFCSVSATHPCLDGFAPVGGLVQATNGKFYGGTYFGGSTTRGTLFRLGVGLGPFVETLPTSGKVGAAVTILGTNLAGATGVKFNGLAASFTVVSGTEIKTSVPVGATTGRITVTTPGGVLKSNIAFRVL
jgi:uncharacterized repeat protein (TIGR03803 family)